MKSAGAKAALVVALLLGAGLLAADAWLRPLTEGERELHAGNYEPALQHFAAAEKRFAALPAAKQALPQAYGLLQTNQLWALYQLGRYDALLEKAALAPSMAPVHFWAGCALFVKAREEQAPEARQSWLGRAGDEFKKALEKAPEDFDTRYNHELTQRLLQETKKQPKTPPAQLMQMLRPKPKEGQPPPKRVG
jgi:hypothetical protein